MEGFQSFFAKMGSNFMVAAFVPSLAFVILTLLVFSPILPPALAESLIGNTNPLIQSTLITIVISTIIGFILTSLNVFIYKLFEGYIVLNKVPFLLKNKVKEAKRIKKQENLLIRRISLLKNRYSAMEKSFANSKENERIQEIEKKKLERLHLQIDQLSDAFEELHSFYDSKYPPSEKYILPTRFGNILRAAETYSETRYQIDGVTAWTRMIKVIDKDYMAYIDTANDQCSFLLYSALLSAAFSGLSIVAIIYQFFLKQQLVIGKTHWLYFVPLADRPIIYDERILVYSFISIIALASAWFFYQASLWNVDQYGDMIRGAYDLYRFKLLEELKLEPPESHTGEKLIWRKISQFYAIGEEAGKIEFDYQVPLREKRNGFMLSSLIRPFIKTK